MNWIKTEDLSRFTDQFKPQLIHPDDPRWLKFWREMKRRCIEGTWFEDFGGWRYGRGNLGFYHHYCRIPDVDKVNKTHGKLIKPLIRDLEWHYSYNVGVARGFSGFSEDDKYTSDFRVFNINKTKFPEDNELCLYKSDGTFKEFIEPLENIAKRHDNPVGIPLYNNDAKNVTILGCHGKGTQVRMYDGSLKNIEDVEIGDRLMGPDSTPRIVKNLFTGEDQLYKVTQAKREPYIVNSKHLLHLDKVSTVRRKGSLKRINIETEKLYNKFKTSYKNCNAKYRGVTAVPIEYDKKDLKLHPYFIGLWLGDGFKREKLICFAENEIEIKRWLIGYAKSDPERFSYNIKLASNQGSFGDMNVYRFRLIDKTMLYKNNYWSKTFRNNKHIPIEYLQSSIDQRLELLAGLLDSDGNYSKKMHRYTFCNSDFNLIKQVEELCWSLGYRTTINSRRVSIKNNANYNLRIYGEIGRIPCKIKRKKAPVRVYKNSKGSNKNVINIEKYSYDTYYGIEVDQDNLYLLKDYTVVHNCRGGGKSLYHILAEVFYDITFDGAKVYNEQIIRNPNQILINVGAGIKGKSAKTLAFMKISSNFLKTSPEAGTWGKIGDDDWEPCPFYKEMTGSFDTDDERGWTNKFSVKVGSAWEERGTGSTVYHVSYSANKRTGAESGAGGRRSLIMYEEIGLFEDLLNAWGSDEAVVSVDGVQFAPRIGVGTSGNIHTIKAAQKIFTHPDDYNCIGYKGKDGEKHCFFLPAYIVDKRFKDKNGNTDLVKAKKYYDDKLEEKLRTNDPAIINNWKMNYPTEIEHMWIASEGQLLPGKEAELREKQLLKNNLYESIGTPISLFWDNNHPDGVNYEVDPTAYPIYDDNLQDKESLEGAVMMYEQPFRINGKIPIDAHIFTHDPYVSDAFDEGGSLGVTHVWINPKYIPYGAKGNCLAATYIGKNKNGLDGYNQVLEKMLAFYGNPMRQLWYESNRGDRLRSHFIKKNKAYLLCLQPQFEQGQHIYLKNTTKTGFVVGSQVSKISMLDRLNDWLLEETDINDEVEKNIFRIPCIFTIRQIRDYTLKGNYDAVSSMMGLPLALGEIEHNIKEGLSRQNNPFSKMSKFLKQRIGQ